MATTINLNGVSYNIADIAETGYGTDHRNYFIALATGVLSKAGGSFTLTGEVDFGASFGLKSLYFKDRGTASSAGSVRLSNDNSIGWRDQANSADKLLKVNTSDLLEFDSNPIVTLALGAANTVLKMNSGGTAYEYGLLANANIDGSAAIDATKIHDGSVSNTEFGYISTLSSNAQDQLDAKLDDSQLIDDDTMATATSSNIPSAESVKAYVDTLDAQNAKTADNETISGTWDFDNPLTMAHNSTPANPAASHNKLYFKSDEKLYKLDSAGNEIEVGSGTGSGEINYIDNGEFESNADNWNEYDDGASATPVDGTGSSAANLTITAESLSGFTRGSKSLKIAKGAADAQGEGVSYDFTIKGQDISKKLKIQFDFKTDEDAGYASGDLTAYIVADPNGTPTVITPVDTEIIRGQNIFQTSFNSTTATEYRLCFHVATTNATAWDAYIDNVIVGPGMTSQGAAVEGATEYTLTASDFANFTGLTVDSSSRILHNRIGDKLFFDFFLRVGGTGTDAASFDFDLSGFLSGLGLTQSDSIYVPFSLFGGGSVGGKSGIAFIQGSDIDFYQYDINNNAYPLLGNDLGASLVRDIGFQCSIPIAEWAGKGIVPMLAEDNLSEWQAYTPTTQGLGTISSNNLEYRRVGDSIQIRGDLTTGSVSATEAQLGLPSGLTVGGTSSSTVVVGNWLRNATTEIEYHTIATKGDSFLNISAKNAGNNPLNAANGSSIAAGSERVSVNTTSIPIAEWAGSQNSLVGYSEASEDNLGLVKKPKSLNYFKSANSGSIASGSPTDVVFNSENHNTYNSGDYNTSTGVFTAPEAGLYLINASVRVVSVTPSNLQAAEMDLILNGSTNIVAIQENISATDPHTAKQLIINTVLSLSSSDTLKLQCTCTIVSGSWLIAGNGSEGRTVLSITKIG